MSSRVLGYLDDVRRAAGARVDRALAGLDAQRAQLDEEIERRPEEVTRALRFLAAKRLLASNTVVRARREGRLAEARAGWDAANLAVHEQCQRAAPATLTLDDLRTINARLTGGEGALRTERLYSCDEEYLGPEHVTAALRALEDHVARATDPPALVAARAYIAVVTVHPFDNGNGRTARLAGDRLLLQSGYLPLCFLSPIASHVATLQGGRTRSAEGSVLLALAAVSESYDTVLRRLRSGVAA